MTNTNLREQIKAILIERGTTRREVPVRLSSGIETHVYLDVKGVLHDGRALFLAAGALVEHLAEVVDTHPELEEGLEGIVAIGGPTMGADVLSHSISVMNHVSYLLDRSDGDQPISWFSIRDRVKTDHGLGRRIEGYELQPGDRVIVTDDVASSGKSLVESVEYVRATGAEVVAVMPLVDRSDKTAPKMADLGVPYFPVLTYADLGLENLK